MTNVTFENVLKVVQALPPQDQRRLRQWLDEQEQQQSSQSSNGETKPTSYREREMRWLAEHEAEYVGQWIALDGDRLLSQGTDPHAVRRAARATGVENPFVVFAEDPDEFFSGAWL